MSRAENWCFETGVISGCDEVSPPHRILSEAGVPTREQHRSRAPEESVGMESGRYKGGILYAASLHQNQA